MKKENGFTLIELLVVISIISLLASIVFASLNSARGKARYARVLSDFDQIRTAAELDADARGGPYAADVCPTQNPFTPGYLTAWPVPPCASDWSYDWENWGGGETIRTTLRSSSGVCFGTAVYYSCIFTTGNCSAATGANINTLASKSISC